MFRKILVGGLVAGAVSGGWLLMMTLAPVGRHLGLWGAVLGYLSMLAGFVAIFAAIKSQRDRSETGRIGFWPGLGMGLAITLIAGFVYTEAWEMALILTHMDFGADYSQALIAKAQARGAGPAEMARVIAQAQAFRAAYADPLQRQLMSFMEIGPVGALVSLLAAALLRNPRFLPRDR